MSENNHETPWEGQGTVFLSSVSNFLPSLKVTYTSMSAFCVGTFSLTIAICPRPRTIMLFQGQLRTIPLDPITWARLFCASRECIVVLSLESRQLQAKELKVIKFKQKNVRHSLTLSSGYLVINPSPPSSSLKSTQSPSWSLNTPSKFKTFPFHVPAV